MMSAVGPVVDLTAAAAEARFQEEERKTFAPSECFAFDQTC
jgi:hypothetical protein